MIEGKKPVRWKNVRDENQTKDTNEMTLKFIKTKEK